jgi:hypothetical protein
VSVCVEKSEFKQINNESAFKIMRKRIVLKDLYHWMVNAKTAESAPQNKDSTPLKQPEIPVFPPKPVTPPRDFSPKKFLHDMDQSNKQDPRVSVGTVYSEDALDLAAEINKKPSGALDRPGSSPPPRNPRASDRSFDPSIGDPRASDGYTPFRTSYPNNFVDVDERDEEKYYPPATPPPAPAPAREEPKSIPREPAPPPATHPPGRPSAPGIPKSL